MKRTFLVWVLRLAHIALILFVLLGWSIPSHTIRIIHLAFVPLVIFHWKTNNDQCIMTQWERRLQGRTEAIGGDFIRSLLKIINIELNDTQLAIFIYGMMSLSFLLGSFVVVFS